MRIKYDHQELENCVDAVRNADKHDLLLFESLKETSHGWERAARIFLMELDKWENKSNE